jgi:hypothetical protein
VSTRAFADALAAADLLVDHRAEVTLAAGGAPLALQGFKVIDEARFKALPDATFLHWRTQGWLGLVHSHLVSIGSWAGLVDRLADDSR